MRAMTEIWVFMKLPVKGTDLWKIPVTTLGFV
jgi:hypothetical protein